METHILRFEHPEYLYWLLAIPVLIAIYILIRIWNKRQFKKFADSKFASFLVPLASSSRSNTKFIIFMLVIILGIFAAANLQTGSKME
jgi:Ca-activated chloride channel family protein